jgi:sulfonate transport system substrate-binding protein
MHNVITRLFSFAIMTILVSSMAHADEIRFATQPIPHYAPIFVAKHKKWLDEELAKVGAKPTLKWASFAAGPAVNESFAAGQEDFGFQGDTPAIVGKAAGINTRIIGLTSSGPKSLAVVVPIKSGIKSPKDLRGKKVAVVKGSYAHHLLVLVLQKGGLTTSDIEFINLSQADIATSIVNGTIDAAAVWEPLLTKLETQGAVRVLTNGTGIKKGASVFIVSNDFVTKHRDQTKAVLKAYQRGADFIKANPKAAAQLIAKDVNLAPDLLLKVLAKFDYNTALQADDIEDLKKVEVFMKNNAIIKSHVNIDTFVDQSLLRELGIIK